MTDNPDGFKTLFNEIKNIEHDKLVLVVGFSIKKDIAKISKIIIADKIILTQADNERAAKIKDFKKYFKNPIIIKNSKKALSYSKKISTKNDLILVAGSIYMIGEII